MTVPLHVLKGPRIPETPGHSFLCAHFNGTLMGAECLRRQTHRNKATAQAKDQSPRVPYHLEYCASGKCTQGKEIAAKFPDWKPEERTKPQGNWASYVKTPTPHEERTRPGRDPLPRAIAQDLADDLAAAAQQAERDRVAAAVEEARPEVATRAPAARKGWDEFRERKESARQAAPAEQKPPRAPHPLSRRALVDEAVGEAVNALREGRIPIRREDKTMNLKGRPSALKGVSDADFKKAHHELGGSVTKLADKFGSAWATTQKRVRALGLGGKAATGAPPRKPAQRRNGAPAPALPVVLPGLLQAQPDSIESLLEQRRAHHLAEAERCGLALRALRGAA